MKEGDDYIPCIYSFCCLSWMFVCLFVSFLFCFFSYISYILQRKTTEFMYKNLICSFSFFLSFITRNVRMGRVQESQRWLKCTHTRAHMHWRATVRFFCETSLPFCFVLPELKSSLVYMFRTPTQSLWSHIPRTHCMWTRLLSSMLLTQLIRAFHRGNTCVLFTLGNRWTSGCLSTFSVQLF